MIIYFLSNFSHTVFNGHIHALESQAIDKRNREKVSQAKQKWLFWGKLGTLISRSDANTNTQDDQSRTEEGGPGAHLLAEDHAGDGRGGEGGGVSHRDGDGDGGAAQDVEEGGGGG